MAFKVIYDDKEIVEKVEPNANLENENLGLIVDELLLKDVYEVHREEEETRKKNEKRRTMRKKKKKIEEEDGRMKEERTKRKIEVK